MHFEEISTHLRKGSAIHRISQPETIYKVNFFGWITKTTYPELYKYTGDKKLIQKVGRYEFTWKDRIAKDWEIFNDM